jgi:di/tricarboxylate transporter
MTLEAWITLAVVIAVLVALIRDLLPPSGAMFAGVAVLLATKVIEPAEAFEGFSNPAPMTIASLYILAKAVQKTGALTPIVRSVLGDGVHRTRSVARLMVPTALASGFFNNTPIVAMLVPPIQRWADQRGQSVSRFLMPLSFAAILGGTLTLIGTATNVVVSGLLESAGQEPIGFFEMTKIGAPVAVLGVAIVIVLAPRLLPDRRSARADAQDEARQFTLDMLVDSGGPLEGRTVESAGLRHLVGVFLASLERDGEELAPVAPTTILRGADRLRFVGKADLVVDLTTLPGISSLELTATEPPDTRRPGYFQAVVGAASPLVGQTLKNIGFRGRYQAVVLAIHRAGQRVDAKLGDVQLRVGDTLLLLSDPGFAARWGDRNDFLLISGTGDAPHGSRGTVIGVAAVTLGIIVSAATGLFPLVTAALLGAAVLVITQILTPGEARDAVDLDVVITIAAAFGLANALLSSGLAKVAADGLVGAFEGLGSRGVLFGIVLATVLVTEMVTNNAAALLIFPIAMAAAADVGMDPRGTAIAVAAMASASFLTPIGYQTNTMVYGPGGYRFSDYVRLGLPLTIAVMAVTIGLVPILWPSP